MKSVLGSEMREENTKNNVWITVRWEIEVEKKKIMEKTRISTNQFNLVLNGKSGQKKEEIERRRMEIQQGSKSNISPSSSGTNPFYEFDVLSLKSVY